jgi:hypothetical protein
LTIEQLFLGLSKTLPGRLDEVLTVPQLMHLKEVFDREFYEAYYDPKTPCPHDGSMWEMNDTKRCGLCGRKVLAVNQKEETQCQSGQQQKIQITK